ncbi:MAG: hypothetical protein ACRDQ0_07395, partial [Pseudonocardia sp.]
HHMTHPQQPGQPNRPGYGYPQQPTQPYGQQPYPPQQGYAPPPPPKRDKGKIIGFSVIGVIAAVVVISIIGAAVGGGGSDEDSGTSDTANNAPADPNPEKADAGGKAKAEDKPEPKEEPKEEEPEPAEDVAVFRVWGDAPSGVDITYGSDSDSRSGTWTGEFEAELPVNGDDDMFFNVFAQLNGSGDINCSVTIGGETDKAHASGSYNICDAQLSSDFTGGWTS